MIPAPFAYSAPNGLAEALTLLAENRDAVVLAGGHNLLTQMKLRRVSPPLVVDLGRIRSLRGIQSNGSGGSLVIGGMTTLNQVAGTPEIRQNYTALAEAAASAGDRQMRNSATIGGSLGYAEFGGDLLAALLALDAQVVTAEQDGERVLSIEEMLEHSTSVSAHRRIVTSINLPAVRGESRSVYERIPNPANNSAICGVAVKLVLAKNGTAQDARVAATDGRPSAVRLSGVESSLSGHKPTAKSIADAVRRANDGIRFQGDRFASEDYRGHLMSTLAETALLRAAGI